MALRRSKKLTFWALMAAAELLLAACSTGDPYVYGGKTRVAGHWRIELQTDRITGAPISSALVTTSHVSNGGIAFTPPAAALQLLCFKERPAILIRFQFKIGSTRNAEMGYRFDDRPGHEPTVRIVEGYKSLVIEDKDEVARLVNEMAASNVLYLRIRALSAPRTSAEFQVDGAPEAITAAYANCPLVGTGKTSSVSPSVKQTAVED